MNVKNSRIYRMDLLSFRIVDSFFSFTSTQNIAVFGVVSIFVHGFFFAFFLTVLQALIFLFATNTHTV